MKLTQCAKGHFYDMEKFAECPYCNGAQNTADRSNENRMTEPLTNQGYMGGSDMDVTRSGVSAGVPHADDNPTVGFADNGGRMTAGYRDPGGRTPTVGDNGETYPYMVWHPQEKDGETAQGGSGNGVRPVVGWLVCTEGSHYGSSFNLYGGKNFIGRSGDMDVALTGDMTVSRVKHAIIIYEPRQRKFFAQPGESHELFYLNGSVVLQSSELHDRDVITIGKTSLIFVPFCDERYGWEN